jgi:3-hydroxyisobutyrate dehydrogenase
MSATLTVGVVGLGEIGGPVAGVLIGAGHPVVGYDVRPEAVEASGVHPVSTLAELGEQADVVLIAVYDAAQVVEVLSGDDSVLDAASPPRAVCILSTVPLETIRWAAEHAASRGVTVLDCGVTGGTTLRTHGRIAVLVGGDTETVEWLRPAFESFAEPLVHMGPLGTGMAAKLARNMIVYGGWFIATEAAGLAAAAGVEIERLIEVCDVADESTGGPVGLLKRGMRPGQARDAEDEKGRARLTAFVHKDLEAAFALADELGVEVAGARLVENAFPRLLGAS